MPWPYNWGKGLGKGAEILCQIEFRTTCPCPLRPMPSCAPGAVGLSPDSVCEIQGRLKRGDWCGTESLEPASFCKSGAHNIRYKCQNCGRVAINPGLLCEPEQMPKPDN